MRGYLYACQGRVCGFTGAALSAGDRGDVEHYRPKKSVKEAPEHGGYWWLAYDVSNYLLANRVSNSTEKSTRFPIAGTRATFETRDALADEEPLLLNPKVDRVEALFDVDLDAYEASGVVRVVAREVSARVEEHIAFFRLNAWVDLLKERRNAVVKCLEAVEAADWDGLRRLACRFAPQSLVALAFLDRVGERHPTEEEDLRIWAEELVVELRIVLEVVDIEEPKGERELEERLWALAVLRCDPGGHPALVAEALGELDDTIVDFARQRGLVVPT